MDKSARITNNNLLEPELSYKLQGCFYSVANKYGFGLKEKIYENALAEELNLINLKFEKQKRIDIHSIDSGKVLGLYVPDFVVENKIIVELKSTNFTIASFIQQQRSYLRASKFEIAYLVNFGCTRIDIRRSIFTNNRKQFICKLQIRDS